MADEWLLSRVKRTLVGAPIPSHLAHHERFSRITGLAVLSSDALSSVAYATEEILRVLMIGGIAALGFVTPIGMVIAAMLAVLVFSYRQTIHAYPSGGGAYIVAKDNLGRLVLDSKPLVVNVDGYCDRVGFGDWKFCDTRPEGDPQRVACDYLVTGKSTETGRWGPTGYYGEQLCSSATGSCNLHPSNQFMAIAKASGTYSACASESWPVAANGMRCGEIQVTVQ